MGNRPVVQIGVFMPYEVQLLDQACVDVFATMSYEYISRLADMAPKAVIDIAPSVKIYYIGSVPKGGHIPVTADQHIVCTNHFSDPEAGPGKLHIVIVPGPFLDVDFEEEPVDWLRRQGHQEGTDILSVCTGVLLCGKAGLLKGRRVCGTRGVQGEIRKRFGSDFTLVGSKLRWVQDGNFWSSGGVTNGNDLVAAYARQSPLFPNPIVELALSLADVGDRAQEYDKGQTRYFLSMGSNMLQAFLLRASRPKGK